MCYTDITLLTLASPHIVSPDHVYYNVYPVNVYYHIQLSVQGRYSVL